MSDAGRAAAEQRQIERNSYGQGEKTESFQITVDGERAEEALDITVGERQYTAEELQDIFARAAEELEVLALGANESLDQVTEDLSLAARLPDLPIAVEWELDRYDVLTVSGEIQETALREALEEEPEGVLVNLKAFMTYTQDQTRQAEYDFLFADGATAGLDNPDLRFEGGACFDHMMSRLVLNITADPSTGISSDDLRDGNYMISGIRHWGFFDPATGTASADQTRQPDNMWRISATPADNGSIRTYTLILFPQNASLTFHAEIGGKEYSCDFQLKLEPSVSYTYGITLKSDSSAGTPGNSRRFSRTNAATEAAGSLKAVQPF